MSTLVGRRLTSMTVDKDGQRDYKIDFLVKCDRAMGEGTLAAYNCSSLPQQGDTYAISVNNVAAPENDLYATCQLPCTVTELLSNGEPNGFFMVQMNFSTKNTNRCQDQKVEDPIQEPPKISFGTQSSKEEATIDLFGNFIENSAHEQIRGPQVEFEASHMTITIEQNVDTADLGYIIPSQMTDCVNSVPLWGLPPRTIKLNRVSGELKYWAQCETYYSRRLEFEVKYILRTDPDGMQVIENWDRRILDEGTKVLRGHWERVIGGGVKWVLDPINGVLPDKDNPKDFIQWKNSDNSHGKVILDGAGQPAGSDTTSYVRYVCISNAPKGSPFPGLPHWVLQGDYDVWNNEDQYEIGDVVLAPDFEEYIAHAINIDDTPPGSSWFLLPTGLNEDAGIWNSGLDYIIGDSVTDGTGRKSTAGSIFVMKYPGVDFSLLGIPLVF